MNIKKRIMGITLFLIPAIFSFADDTPTADNVPFSKVERIDWNLAEVKKPSAPTAVIKDKIAEAKNTSETIVKDKTAEAKNTSETIVKEKTAEAKNRSTTVGTNKTAETKNTPETVVKDRTAEAKNRAATVVIDKTAEAKNTSETIVIDRTKAQREIYSIRFQEGRVQGKGADNNYFAPYITGVNNSLLIRKIAGTRMVPLFEMENFSENDYFRCLEKVYRWELHNQKLKLYTYDKNNEEAILEFVPIYK